MKKKISAIKNTVAAIFAILSIVVLCTGAMLVFKGLGIGKRKYLVVEEN